MDTLGQYTPEEIIVAAGVAAGKSCRAIEAETGISKSKVNDISNRNDVKALIEKCAEELASKSYVQAIDNITRAVSDFKSTADPDYKKICWDATKEVAKSMGILSSHTMSLHIQNLYQQNNMFLSPILQQLLGQIQKDNDDNDEKVIDGELYE